MAFTVGHSPGPLKGAQRQAVPRKPKEGKCRNCGAPIKAAHQAQAGKCFYCNAVLDGTHEGEHR
jgi:hypothetical protein